MQVNTDLLDSRQVHKAQGDRNQVLVTRFNLALIFKSLAISLYLFHNWKWEKRRKERQLVIFILCRWPLLIEVWMVQANSLVLPFHICGQGKVIQCPHWFTKHRQPHPLISTYMIDLLAVASRNIIWRCSHLYFYTL